MVELRRGALAVLAIACAATARAETRFDVSVERLQIEGDAPFVDELDGTPPRSHFVERGASEVRQQGGALRLTDDDGAGQGLLADTTVLDRALRAGAGPASVSATFRGPAPARPREREGLLLLRHLGPAALEVAARLVVFRGLVDVSQPAWTGGAVFGGTPWDPYPVTVGIPLAEVFTPSTRCGVGGGNVVALEVGSTVVACDDLAADAALGPITLRLSVDGEMASMDAAYSTDGGVHVHGLASWKARHGVSPPRLGRGPLFPGLSAGTGPEPGAQWVDYAGFAAGGGIARGAGGALVSIAGALSRQRFPTLPAPDSPATAGTFLLTSAGGLDLRRAPGVAELLTPRGRLRAVGLAVLGPRPRDLSSGRPLREGAAPGAHCETGAEPDCLLPLLSVVCSTSIGFSSLDTDCGRPMPREAAFYASQLGGLFLPGSLLWPQTAADLASLTPAQQALLGCGPFFGRPCTTSDTSPGGIDLWYADPSVLLQSWLEPDAPPWPQPGTGGYQGGPICTRVTSSGTAVVLPGCRGPGTPGYDPVVDGPDPTNVSIGYPPGGAIPGLPGPSSSSPLAALSWSLQTALVPLSVPLQTPDPAHPDRTDGCSYQTPQRCSAVRALRSLAVDPAADDPTAPPPRRWVWETGAVYRITEATGEFAELLGGTLYVPGPLATKAAGAVMLVPFFASPPLSIDADRDGVRDARDRCVSTPNATQEDVDRDGVGDACDVCILQADPLQRDTDRDGIGNRCDPDLDNDGMVNAHDLAILKRRFFTRDRDADFNGDGIVSFSDLLLLRSWVYRAPGPAAPHQRP